MCNACGFGCCAHDAFHGCGCDCDEKSCWERCDHCRERVPPWDTRDCDCEYEDEDEAYDEDFWDEWAAYDEQMEGAPP